MGRPMKQLSLTSRWPGLEVSRGIIISSGLMEICIADIFGFWHNQMSQRNQWTAHFLPLQLDFTETGHDREGT